jgi:CDP-paratose 2-epimerase
MQHRTLRYLGFGGLGHQVRDCLHPRDLTPLMEQQFAAPALGAPDRVVNVSGGLASAMSLRQLSNWCACRFGAQNVVADGTPRPFDIPWIVLDHAKATRLWNWHPQTPVAAILDDIAVHAQAHPEWLDISAPL